MIINNNGNDWNDIHDNDNNNDNNNNNDDDDDDDDGDYDTKGEVDDGDDDDDGDGDDDDYDVDDVDCAVLVPPHSSHHWIVPKRGQWCLVIRICHIVMHVYLKTNYRISWSLIHTPLHLNSKLTHRFLRDHCRLSADVQIWATFKKKIAIAQSDAKLSMYSVSERSSVLSHITAIFPKLLDVSIKPATQRER